MFEVDKIKELLSLDESPILEFKREWYWKNETHDTELGKKWGEFFKDIISLCNGYLSFSGKDRYLIIGYCEKERKIYDVARSEIKVFSDIREFRKKTIQRLERLVSIPPLTIKIDFINIENKTILVIKIPSPKYITELKSELITKTRTLDAGSVLVRKGQEQDSVRIATPAEIGELATEFDKFKNSDSISISMQPSPKERSISKTVQLYIEKNMSYSIDLDYPISSRDRSEGVIFELFKISEDLGGSKYFLYIHEHASQTATSEYIKLKKLINSPTNLIILTERPSIKDIEKRKDNLSRAFGTKHVYFIDEFGLKYLYGDIIQEYENYNLPVFVDSLTTEYHDGENSALTILKKWHQSIASPLMVVKGYGGIGKSTLAKQFLDKIGEENKSIGLVFIDSNDIVDRLSKNTRAGKKIDDLYDFYIAQHQSEEISTKNFSKDLLKLSIDNGNLLIVLDGIDEVIAKLGSKFDVACFVNSILEGYSNNLERGKVLITCRDNFWRDLEKSENIREITLTPFNLNLAKDFFSQAFEKNVQKIERAVSMADKFAIKENTEQTKEAVYIPYVLDMISYLIKHKQEFGESDVKLATETTTLLPGRIPNDFLIGSVCEREIKKLGNCSIDDQINFLIYFSASSPNGHVSMYDVKNILEKSTSIQINSEFIEKLKGHPLLSYSNNSLNFRYDFFYQYFKSLYVARYFSDGKIDNLVPSLIDLLGTYIGFDNDFTRSLCKRIQFCEDLLIFSMLTIDEIKVRLQKSSDAERNTLRSAISGVFALLLSLKREEKKNLDIESCTELLKQVFHANDMLDGVCLIRISSSDRAKVIFDLRNTTIKNSHFEQYEYFWDCFMNENTRFNSSSFLALEPRSGVRPQLFDGMFGSDCDVADIIEIISKRKKEVSNVIDELKDTLYQFFKLFYKQGNFYPKKQDDVRARLYTGKILPILLKHKVVIDYHDPKKGSLKQYKITDEFRPIIKLFEQGGVSLEFEKVIKMFG